MTKHLLCVILCFGLFDLAQARPATYSLTDQGKQEIILPHDIGYKEPISTFITVEEVDQHYTSLTTILKQVSTNHRLEGKPFVLPSSIDEYYPPLPNENHSDGLKTAKFCPIRRLEGVHDPHRYIDYKTLAFIKDKKLSAPKNKKLLQVDPLTRWAYLPPSVSHYQKVAFDFAKQWNKEILPLCMKKAGIYDMSAPRTQNVTHQVVGDTLFILNDKPMTNPRKEEMSPKEKKVYFARLKQAINTKNPEVEAKIAIANQQYYLLNKLTIAVPRLTYPPKPRITMSSPYGDGISSRKYRQQALPISIKEGILLEKACPPKLIEGDWRYGDDDPNEIYLQYATRWNKTVLPICQNRVAKMFPRAMTLLTAMQKWNRIPTTRNAANKPLLTYSYTLQSNNLFGQKAVRITVKNGKVISMTKQNKAIKQDQKMIMEELFAMIQQAINDKVLRLSVVYDPKYGNPTSILIQHKAGSPIMTYTITDFQT